MRTRLVAWGAVVALLWGTAGPALADPLNVTDFDSLGGVSVRSWELPDQHLGGYADADGARRNRLLRGGR